MSKKKPEESSQNTAKSSRISPDPEAKKSKRSTPTNQQLAAVRKEKAAEEDKPTSEQKIVRNLREKWVCKSEKCKNFPTGQCWVLPEKKIHHKLISSELILWCRGILKEEATLKIPPAELILRWTASTPRTADTASASASTVPAASEIQADSPYELMKLVIMKNLAEGLQQPKQQHTSYSQYSQYPQHSRYPPDSPPKLPATSRSILIQTTLRILLLITLRTPVVQ